MRRPDLAGSTERHARGTDLRSLPGQPRASWPPSRSEPAQRVRRRPRRSDPRGAGLRLARRACPAKRTTIRIDASAGLIAGRPSSNRAEMPKRLFDRLTLVGRARLEVTIATGASRPTHGRYAMNLLDVSDPSRFRDEAVVTLHELLNLGRRGYFVPSTIVPTCMRGPMMPA